MRTSLSIIILALILTSCNNDLTTKIISDNNLAAKVEHGDKMVTKTVFESHYKMILFALKKGQDLKPHSAPMDAPLVMLEGSARVTIGDNETVVQEGDIFTLPKNIDHGVYPMTNCKFLLIK